METSILLLFQINRAWYQKFLDIISEDYRVSPLRMGDKLLSFVLDTDKNNVNNKEMDMNFDVPSAITVEFTKGEHGAEGAVLLKVTGSGEFNVKLRIFAQKQGYKLNEYGLFDANNNFVAGKTEKEIFDKLGLPNIPPKDREKN